jgi:hypothetical protein
LAHVQWKFGEGDAKVTNPSPDVVVVSFDACSDFAQENVRYVLTTDDPPTTECLEPLSTTEQGSLTFTIFEVVPPE